MWLRVFEAYLTARLLQSPTFHRIVYNITHRLHNGNRPPPAPYDDSHLGGTADGGEQKPGFREFLRIYKEEFRDSLRGKEGDRRR